MGQHRVHSTWLAFTLLHSVFPSAAEAASAGPLLSAIRSAGDSRVYGTGGLTTSGASDENTPSAYLFRVLSFLDLSCGVGVTRAAVNLLKKMIQVSVLGLLSDL